MSKETEHAAGRRAGQSPGAAEYVEKETKDAEWWAVDRRTGEIVKGTKAELLKLVSNG